MEKNRKKIAFLDRDGVINRLPAPHCYITKTEDFVLNPGIIEVLKNLAVQNFEFIIVTNQRGIARGLMSEKDLLKIHSHMEKQFEVHDIKLLDVIYCPHEKNICDCRKPKPGMLKTCLKKYPIDLAQSLFISDSIEDLQMAKNFGIGTQIHITANKPLETLNFIIPSLKNTKNKKIRIAFIKFGGLSAGGTEKFLQIIAANLPKNEFEVDYYYCGTAPYVGSDYRHMDTDPFRVQFMKDHGVNLIEFHVGAKDITVPTHRWIDTNFWETFDETKYDIIQTGKAGHKEYPFTKIRKTSIVDSLHLASGSDNQFNISRVMHICQWSADGWIKRGGDKSRIVLVSLPISIEAKDYGNFRKELGLEKTFIFGMHQRPDNNTYSEIPLAAYARIENDKTAYIMLGGSELYRKQATKLGIKHIFFLPATGDSEKIFKFLNTLDVYAHGRRDGEVNSQAMAEALYFGTPIVSHISPVNNGHAECIGYAGKVVDTVDAYATELKHHFDDPAYHADMRKKAKRRFAEKYELHKQMDNFIDIYRDVFRNPFPHPWRRRFTSMHYTQNVRVWAIWVHLKIKKIRRKLIKFS